MEIVTQNQVEKVRIRKANKNMNISSEDNQILHSLEMVTRDLKYAHQSFDLSSNTALTDAFIYEILSLNKKYEYYIKLCKEKGLIVGG